MIINSIQKQILKELYNSYSGVSAFTLGKKFRITPGVLIKSISKFVKKQFIDIEDHKISLTEIGRKELISMNINIKRTETESWRNFPNQFLQPKINVNQPIPPKISDLDPLFFVENKE